MTSLVCPPAHFSCVTSTRRDFPVLTPKKATTYRPANTSPLSMLQSSCTASLSAAESAGKVFLCNVSTTCIYIYTISHLVLRNRNITFIWQLSPKTKSTIINTYPINNIFQQAKYYWKYETLYPSSDSPNKAVNTSANLNYQTQFLFVCLQPEWLYAARVLIVTGNY